MFQRIISIDWSGGEEKTEDDYVNLRIAVWQQDRSWIQRPPNAYSGRRKWARSECRSWLLQQLQTDERRTLVTMDFGFGLPWGSDQALFGVSGWEEMIKKIAGLYSENGTARKTAKSINALKCNEGHGPYRLGKDDRTDFRFYLDKGVGYCRLADIAVPQAISQWYLGAGPKVGYHSITGMSALSWLITQRHEGKVDFRVWPHELHENLEPTGHVLAECYPAICPIPKSWGECQGGDERDAWKVLQFLVAANQEDRINSLFDVPELPFGRIDSVPFRTQIRFEGFIIGVK